MASGHVPVSHIRPLGIEGANGRAVVDGEVDGYTADALAAHSRAHPGVDVADLSEVRFTDSASGCA